MGQTRKRVGKDGKPRYTAYYDDIRGQRRSAGTYASKKEAEKAWQRAEVKVSEGRTGEPARGRQRFKDYVEDTWLPNHEMEASTRSGYTYTIYKHIMPEFGCMRMVDILPEHVRAWIAKLKKQGMTPVTIRCTKIILSAIFTTALEDQVTFLHPCRGVKAPPVVRKPLKIVTPEQFDDIYHALPEGTFRLLTETEIESGLRWGELSELRAKDLNLRTRILTVSRTVVELNPKFHPDGGHFLVKDYPKDKEYRRFKLSAQMAEKLEDHIRTLCVRLR
ncbi:tyrosine-type recombinase/integrase [Spirillospora sp. NPDC048824]|uniref:tyrosine-type recombinase/integrase n=1 Tax=Spirillospora sp. NPDC048824 TaxID=3364526 RepID=UPI003713D2C6